ncbi:helix-turn-helix domain-containing protein [Desulfuromonas acetoxidans]|uniref:helix-turn-helix domain-containing protein n=1 Tax=Desulfuromonas acetoxidans TaxID=891 RepID=UPI000053D2F5|nr:helix-turn-helix domain-containing protein [Desulfuromonas acetoxidans]MBF0646919.1 helix-turn-helix domain-containing protein [Desulfuromonas acetoxidans]NVD23870.1 helix-turn-helix domain-containing protein [Desulfuromonas acetoxidans]NVE16167.1 helix-turn-helix domain-containing protein [Desulfuromonas acetoxidans]
MDGQNSTPQTPLEIKIALMRKNCLQADIARICEVSRSHVNRVIKGNVVSDRVQRQIASEIGYPVEEVFPDRYPASGPGPRVQPVEHRAAS